MSVLLGNRQCGYQIAQRIMDFARTLPEFSSLPRNYIIDGAVENVGTQHASTYALRPMKYRAKGAFLDSLIGALPPEFLDFTAERDPMEPNADAWGQTEWFAHVARELELWKYMKSSKKTR